MSTCPTIQLHASVQPFSRIVYGAWRLADAPDTSPQAVLAKLHACLDQGITTIDHADIYGDYRCETLFGEALRTAPALRSRLQHVSKCDIMLLSSQFPERRVKHYDTTPAHIRASVQRSLQRLHVERLDVLLLHRPDPLMDADATGACLDALVDSGEVAAVGVSNFLPHDWQLLQSRMRHPLVTNQIELSLGARSAFTDGQLAFAQQHRIRPMAWSPLGGGALMTGASPAGARVLPALQRLAAQQGVGPEAVALAWLLAHPAGILPVVGTQQLARIARLHEAWRTVIDRETWFELWTLAAGSEVP
ncbi:aldo/keto reductase [Pseudaquabacterium pictum]|uniref:Aryl-alcohol dehydrogenase n=1 Tax=Pseudaquabacterium pictum TaxID=2315236 RepID=A0A480AZ54_9BURK|nr:aldo/keto reductase [Rubrivivax pictus]GCL64995.1 aryl-alcohol dehydrogenase [Rubrivivax pictus]